MKKGHNVPVALNQTWVRSSYFVLTPLHSNIHDTDREISMHRFTLLSAKNEFLLWMVVVLKMMKFFNLLSQGLHNGCGKDSLCVRGLLQIFSTAASRAQFPLPYRFFQWEILPIDLEVRFFLPTDLYTFLGVFGRLPLDILKTATWHFTTQFDLARSSTWVYCDNNTFHSPLASEVTNFTLICPSPDSFVFNLPDSGRNMTRPNEGLSTGRREKLGTRLVTLYNFCLNARRISSCHAKAVTRTSSYNNKMKDNCISGVSR